MYATPLALITAFRAQSRDTIAPYLWKDSELYEFATQAESLVAFRTMCLLDITSVAAVADVSAGEPMVDLHHSVLRIRSATLIQGNTEQELDIKSLEAASGYRLFTTTGTPCAVITGVETNKLRLYPIPVADATLQLAVFRMPLLPLTATSKFEVPFQYTGALIEWMRHRAYGKVDSDIFNPSESAQGLAAYENLVDGYITSESLRRGGAQNVSISYGGI